MFLACVTIKVCLEALFLVVYGPTFETPYSRHSTQSTLIATACTNKIANIVVCRWCNTIHEPKTKSSRTSLRHLVGHPAYVSTLKKKNSAPNLMWRCGSSALVFPRIMWELFLLITLVSSFISSPYTSAWTWSVTQLHGNGHWMAFTQHTRHTASNSKVLMADTSPAWSRKCMQKTNSRYSCGHLYKTRSSQQIT